DDMRPRLRVSTPTRARPGRAASAAPLERVAERQAEQLGVEVVHAGVETGRRYLIEQRLARPAAPVVLLDVLEREVTRQVRRKLHREPPRELVAVPLRQQRRHRLVWCGALVVAVAAAQRPLRVLH